jgi:hypothetical protein
MMMPQRDDVLAEQFLLTLTIIILTAMATVGADKLWLLAERIRRHRAWRRAILTDVLFNVKQIYDVLRIEGTEYKGPGTSWKSFLLRTREWETLQADFVQSAFDPREVVDFAQFFERLEGLIAITARTPGVGPPKITVGVQDAGGGRKFHVYNFIEGAVDGLLLIEAGAALVRKYGTEAQAAEAARYANPFPEKKSKRKRVRA